MRSLGFGLLLACTVLGIGLACGPPDSFDDLVGGVADAGDERLGEASPGDAQPDKTLAAPRPVSPLSATWVNGSRPHFTWQLPPEAIGAHVQLCRDRNCQGDTQTYEAVGSAFDPPADLAPGFWYWHLLSKTAGGIGTQYSPSWEVLVRGGTKASTHASGTVVDIDGNGRPDLVVSIQFSADAGAGVFGNEVAVFLATNADSSEFLTQSSDGFGSFGLGVVDGPPTSIANPAVAAVDSDGDGFSDLIVADNGIPLGSPQMTAYLGSATGLTQAGFMSLNAVPTTDLPILREAPDSDGDGFGDLIVSTSSMIYSMYGSAHSLGASAFLFTTAQLFPDSGFLFSPASIPVLGSFDRNGDGLSDSVASWQISDQGPVYIFSGSTNRFQPGDGFLTTAPPPAPPTQFASGDFDGDGKADLAFATVVGAKPSICVLRGADSGAAVSGCWSPTVVPAGFASSMTAADVEPDGNDEILVGSTSGGVDVLRLSGTTLSAEHITTPFGATLTTIHPGRPTPATWAASRPDGAAIQIFKGTALGTAITATPGTQFGPTLR